MFIRESSFWRYNVSADIRRGSLENTRQMTMSHVLHIGVAYFYSLSVCNKATGPSDVGFVRDGRRFQ